MEEKNNQQQQLLMELSEELNKLKKAQARVKRRTTFLLSVIAMLVLITATLAWFTLSNFASINDITLNISTAPELYLEIENRGTEDLSLWKKTLTNDMINTYLTSVNAPEINKQLLDPVTSSNGINFFSQAGVARNANSDTYMEFKVWFLATKDMYVHLSGQKVEVEGVESTTSVTTTETGLKADIVNCLRVSFEDESVTGNAPIYEPNKGTAVGGQTTFEVSENFSNDTRVFYLDAMTPKQITIRIWMEGEDPECDNDVQAANVTLAMLFGGTDENNETFE